MGFLERAIRRGVSDAVDKVIGDTVRKAVEPAATELANKAAESIDRATEQTEQKVYRQSGLEGAFSNLQRSVESYATEQAKNIKICPSCGEAATADKKFCPHCGSKLPETTVAQGAVCPNCGKQNTVGTKFCSDCGAKLPAAIEEEQAEAAKAEEVMTTWDELLSVFPKWNCGGYPVDIQEIDTDQYIFIVDFKGNSRAAKLAVEEYKDFAMQKGFHPAGEYPSNDNLYNKINGVCYHVDLEHCFDGDPDCPTLGFGVKEPYGGYDYVKPEPKKQVSLKDLFKF